MLTLRTTVILACVLLCSTTLCADEPAKDAATPDAGLPLIGYTQTKTNLPGGRHANVRMFRAMRMRADGTEHQLIAAELADEPNAWTQFVGWSPDGQQAIVSRGWQDPENAAWEDEHKTFRFLPDKWLLDSSLVNLKTGKLVNVTAVERVSSYNGGLFFLPEGKGLGFTPLIGGLSKPYVMELDGTKKRDVSGQGGGFAYGYSASPDGKLISYHENYQVYVSKADGTEKRQIVTGNPFNFGPRWSADGQWLLFVSGEHYNCHPYIVRADGTGLQKIGDRAGYRGVTEFLDVFDFHGGSSDVPVWSADGKSVFFTAKVGENVELFEVTLTGETKQLTQSPAGSLHYHPTPAADGKQLLYGSKRAGVRNLYVMNLADHSERQLTQHMPGEGAMWPHWQPVAQPAK